MFRTTAIIVTTTIAATLLAPAGTQASPVPTEDDIAFPVPEPIVPDDQVIVQGETPPLEVIHVETDTSFGDTSTQGTVIFAETTAPTGSTQPGWWLRVDLTVRNNGDEPVLVPALGVTTDVSALSVSGIETVEIAPGATKLFKPHDITGTGNPPTWFTVNVYAPATAPYPAQATYPIEIYENATPTGGYRFPAKASDLPAGVFWTPGSHHAHSRSQRFAYDFKAVRWDHGLAKWTNYTEQAYEDDANGIDAGSLNEHFLIWGAPVYSMSSGWIVKCRRSQPDHLPGSEYSVSGANSLLISHGNGEFAAYAHLQQDSIPATLCPAESPVTDDDPDPEHQPVYVHEGQFLGLVGNSGPSTGPHGHIHLTDSGADVSSHLVRGLPLNFHDVFVHTYDGFDPTVHDTDWNWVSSPEAAAIDRKQLIHPNTCGWEVDGDVGGYATGGRSAPQRIGDCRDEPDPLARPVDVLAVRFSTRPSLRSGFRLAA